MNSPPLFQNHNSMVEVFMKENGSWGFKGHLGACQIESFQNYHSYAFAGMNAIAYIHETSELLGIAMNVHSNKWNLEGLPIPQKY